MTLPGHWDVAVVGAGPAGVAAAIAAARNNARTILVERYGFLGGDLTGALIAPFMTSFFKEQQVNRGILQEVIDRLVAIEGSLGHMPCSYEEGSTWGTGGSITLFDSEKMKSVLQQMTKEAGVDLLLHTQFTETLVEGRELRDLTGLTKSGTVHISAKQIVDATGDADVAARAGVATEKGASDGAMQPASLFFHLADVDAGILSSYVRENPKEFAWHTFPQAQVPIPPGFTSDHVAGSGFFSLIENGKRSGELQVGRERITFFTGLRRGQLIMNATRVSGIDGTDVIDLTRAEIEGREQVVSVTDYARKHFPGFGQCYVLSTGVQVGIRETRHVVGEYVLSAGDIIHGTTFEDTVARGAFPVDIHQPEGAGNVWIEVDKPFSIPYRSLVPLGVDNLLVAGRTISGDHQAHAAFRVMPICFSTGEAAGTAAAIASQSDMSVRDIDTERLRERLLAQNMVI